MFRRLSARSWPYTKSLPRVFLARSQAACCRSQTPSHGSTDRTHLPRFRQNDTKRNSPPESAGRLSKNPRPHDSTETPSQRTLRRSANKLRGERNLLAFQIGWGGSWGEAGLNILSYAN